MPAQEGRVMRREAVFLSAKDAKEGKELFLASFASFADKKAHFVFSEDRR
jgi:hypothetical protein